jgi:hypothetical protein
VKTRVTPVPDPRLLPCHLFVFGPRSAPRVPRLFDFAINLPGIVGPELPPNPKGASTFADPHRCGLRGHYHGLPGGFRLPDGLEVVADGRDVGGRHLPTHHTIYPTIPMQFDRFVELFRQLPWKYSGEIKRP